jgi:tRNA modification GTPase
MEKASSSGLSFALAGGADTIVARSSPAGRGGLALIRVSGGETRRLAGLVCPDLDMSRGWRASLVGLFDSGGGLIDRGVALPFPAPRSYTGEDMLEVMVHGSGWVIQSTIDAFIAAGARPAGPGEFTRRAVANGKLDLVQAEAINELTLADTAWQARVARAQIEGRLSGEFAGLKEDLTELLVELEAALDFAHHEIPYDREAAVLQRDRCLARTTALLATASAGRRIRDGVRIVILGPPNSGKSTLFNLLVGAEKAIVSPHPGTTRDVVEVELEVAGVRVILQDTAGLGSTVDPVEREGIRRARDAAAGADAVVLLWPADQAMEAAPSPREHQSTLRIRSKWDLAEDESVSAPWLALSCETGEGVDELRRALAEVVTADIVDLGGEVAIAERHRGALEAAVKEMESADFELPELAAEGVRAALDSARELTGEVMTEDVLDRIFGSFCIGK